MLYNINQKDEIGMKDFISSENSLIGVGRCRSFGVPCLCWECGWVLWTRMSLGAAGNTSTSCSVVMYRPMGTSWRMSKMSEEVSGIMWCYSHLQNCIWMWYLIWRGSNIKHTGPKVVHFDRSIFNQMSRRRKDKRVTSVVDVVGALNRAWPVNGHVLVPDNGLVAALDTL